MYDYFIINCHSFVDLITNSSTELFIYSGDKGISLIKKIIEKSYGEELDEELLSIRKPNKWELFLIKNKKNIKKSKNGKMVLPVFLLTKKQLLDFSNYILLKGEKVYFFDPWLEKLTENSLIIRIEKGLIDFDFLSEFKNHIYKIENDNFIL